MVNVFKYVRSERQNLGALVALAKAMKVTNLAGGESLLSPDTLRELNANFYYMAWGRASESTVVAYLKLINIVTYWPLTEPSIVRCTCVNKRRKRKQVGEKKYDQDSDSLSKLEMGCQQSENQRQTEGPQWPTVEQPSQDVTEVLLWSEELRINM